MELEELERSARSAIEAAKSREALEEVRIHYLGRKGELTTLLRSLGDMSLEERRERGPRVQSFRTELERLIEEKENRLVGSHEKTKRVDFTAPGKKASRGHVHPLTLIDRETRAIFKGMNFSVVEGP